MPPKRRKVVRGRGFFQDFGNGFVKGFKLIPDLMNKVGIPPSKLLQMATPVLAAGNPIGGIAAGLGSGVLQKAGYGRKRMRGGGKVKKSGLRAN